MQRSPKQSVRTADLAVFQPSARPIFRYSVIPGGAYDAAELFRALESDDLARSHYAAFSLSRAHPVRLQRSRVAYVSYRMNGAIYWTRRAVRLPEGETLLTDGLNFARARCGNRIADTPQQPISGKEPDAVAIDQPLPPDLSPVTQPLIAPPVFTAPDLRSQAIASNPAAIGAPPATASGSLPVGWGATGLGALPPFKLAPPVSSAPTLTGSVSRAPDASGNLPTTVIFIESWASAPGTFPGPTVAWGGPSATTFTRTSATTFTWTSPVWGPATIFPQPPPEGIFPYAPNGPSGITGSNPNPAGDSPMPPTTSEEYDYSAVPPSPVIASVPISTETPEPSFKYLFLAVAALSWAIRRAG